MTPSRVERLKKAGAVVVGMGATSEFACKGVTTSPLFGPTRHPLDPDLTPGGSSGGPATAVAAGPCTARDRHGRRRLQPQPAGHVGVVGFKPSYGAIPYGPGFAEPFFDISVIAPIARNVADAALAFEAMAGPDPRDCDSTRVESGDVDLADLRVAFSPKLGLDTPVDPTIAGRLEVLVEHLGKRGQRIVRRDPVWPPGATEEALMPLQHAGLAALYGADFQKDPGQFDPDVARQIERGLSLRGLEVAAALVQAQLSEPLSLNSLANSTFCWRRPFPVLPGPLYNSAQK